MSLLCCTIALLVMSMGVTSVKSIANPTHLFKELLTLLPQNDIGGGKWCDERGGAGESSDKVD